MGVQPTLDRGRCEKINGGMLTEDSRDERENRGMRG